MRRRSSKWKELSVRADPVGNGDDARKRQDRGDREVARPVGRHADNIREDAHQLPLDAGPLAATDGSEQVGNVRARRKDPMMGPGGGRGRV
ncbi:MAG: hypothetical protein NZ773_16105, partial [Dehalococcoidia bacterium]|nr:hypothetical protein [Dehalococcoidia bacterium]